MIRRVAFAACLAVSVLAVTPAHADPVAVAKEHFRKGSLLFDLRRYHEAAKEYEAAYEAVEDAKLLFNIAQAYRYGAEYDDAIASYHAYLRRSPHAANRDEVEARIREMKDLIAQQKKTATSPPEGVMGTGPVKPAAPTPIEAPKPAAVEPSVAKNEPVVEPPPLPIPPSPAEQPLHPGRTKQIAGLAVGIAGVVALAAGAGLAIQAHALSDQNEMGTFNPQADADGKTYQSAAIGLLAVGGAAVVAGVVVGVLGLREARAARVAIVPVVGPTTAGVSATVRF